MTYADVADTNDARAIAFAIEDLTAELRLANVIAAMTALYPSGSGMFVRIAASPELHAWVQDQIIATVPGLAPDCVRNEPDVDRVREIENQLDEAYQYWLDDGEASGELDSRHVYYGCVQGIARALAALRGTTELDEIRACRERRGKVAP